MDLTTTFVQKFYCFRGILLVFNPRCGKKFGQNLNFSHELSKILAPENHVNFKTGLTNDKIGVNIL
jgi:hypothetical protein